MKKTVFPKHDKYFFATFLLVFFLVGSAVSVSIYYHPQQLWVYGTLLLLVSTISYLLSVLRNSHTQKTKALQQNEILLKAAQEIAHVGNWLWDVPSDQITWSEETYRIFGYKPGQFTPSYKFFIDAVHPDDVKQVEAMIDAALHNNSDYAVDHRILMPNGEIHFVREIGIVEFNQDGSAARMLGTVQDITDIKTTQRELEIREAQLRALIEQAPQGIFIADLNGRYTQVNVAGCRLLGYERGELLGKSILDLIPAEDAPRLQATKEYLLGGNTQIEEWQLRHKQGYYIPVEISSQILADGRWQGFVHDLRERKKAEEKQRQAASVFDNTSEAILITDNKNNIVAVNQAYQQITGFSETEVLGKNPNIHRSMRQADDFYQTMWHALQTTGQWQGEIWNRRKNGEIYPAWETLSAVKDTRGNITNYVALISDISSVKEAEQKLSHLAHHDALTELPNRLAFVAHLEQALEHAKRNNNKLALFFLDLDRFKLINDTLGHHLGDELLKCVARRLTSCSRAEDMVSRLGGDEFTVIMADIKDSKDAAILSEKIIKAISNPIHIEQHEVATSTSIGISIFPDDADNVADLLKAADAAMYRAKSQGRGCYEYYTSDMTVQALRRLTLENELRQALTRNEFFIHYQPQINLASGECVGVEALLRWQHPQIGLIMPDQFIGVAEDSGLIEDIGNWVIQEVFSQASQWKYENRPLRVAINISGRQIVYDQLLTNVEQALHNNTLANTISFEFEITESILQTGENVIATLERLRSLGIRIAIDDFGTGYSSLSQLKHLPVDTLKIDRAFLEKVPEDPDSIAIAKSIISLGHHLGLKVISEGVENTAQLKFLKENNCDECQGFLISKAIDANAIALVMNEKEPMLSQLSLQKTNFH